MSIHKITPMIPISDYKQSVEFYTKALSFKLLRGDCNIGWGLLEGEGGCQLMIDQSIRSKTNAAIVVYFYTANIEAIHKQVTSAGYQAEPVEKTFYGMTEFRINDPDGNELWIGLSKAKQKHS